MLVGDVSDALWPSLNQNGIPHRFYSSNNCPTSHISTWLHTSAPFLDHPRHLSDKVSRLVSMSQDGDKQGQCKPWPWPIHGVSM